MWLTDGGWWDWMVEGSFGVNDVTFVRSFSCFGRTLWELGIVTLCRNLVFWWKLEGT